MPCELWGFFFLLCFVRIGTILDPMWAEWLLLLILLDGFTRLGWFPHMLALISFPLKNSRRTFCRSSEHFLCSSVLILCPLSFKSICSLYSQLHIFNSASAEGQRHTTGSEATRTDMVSDHPLEHQPPLWLLPRPWHPSSLPDSLSYGLEVPASGMETTYSQRLLNRLPQLCGAPSSNNPLIPYSSVYFYPFYYGFYFSGWTQANTLGIFKRALPASWDGNRADCVWSLAWGSQSRNVKRTRSLHQEVTKGHHQRGGSQAFKGQRVGLRGGAKGQLLGVKFKTRRANPMWRLLKNKLLIKQKRTSLSGWWWQGSQLCHKSGQSGQGWVEQRLALEASDPSSLHPPPHAPWSGSVCIGQFAYCISQYQDKKTEATPDGVKQDAMRRIGYKRVGQTGEGKNGMRTGIVQRSGICYLDWSCCCGFWNSVAALTAVTLLEPVITSRGCCFQRHTQGEAPLPVSRWCLLLTGLPR